MNRDLEYKIISCLEFCFKVRNDKGYFSELNDNAIKFFKDEDNIDKELLESIVVLNYYNRFTIETYYLIKNNIFVRNTRSTLNSIFYKYVSSTKYYSIVTEKSTLEQFAGLIGDVISSEENRLRLLKSSAIFNALHNANDNDNSYNMARILCLLGLEHFSTVASFSSYLRRERVNTDIFDDCLWDAINLIKSSNKYENSESELDRLTRIKNGLIEELESYDR